MKALSVRQPWADMICSGQKWLEFRSRPISHRGDLLICASKFNEGYVTSVRGEDRPLPLGVMLCVVKVIDCKPTTRQDSDQPGYPGDDDGWYSWVFDDYIDILVPKQVKGMVNLFTVPDDQIQFAPEGKFWFDYL